MIYIHIRKCWDVYLCILDVHGFTPRLSRNGNLSGVERAKNKKIIFVRTRSPCFCVFSLPILAVRLARSRQKRKIK